MATVPASLHDLVHIIRAVIVVDQGNLSGFGARQYARGDAWAKAKFRHGGVHFGLGPRTHIRMVVEHAADGFHRHASELCDIADVGARVHSANAVRMEANRSAYLLSARVKTGGWPFGAAMLCVPLA